MMAVDMDGAFYACRAVLPGMIHQSTAASCWSAVCGARPADCEVSSAAKAGPHRSGQGAGKESEGSSGITVNVIAPGVIDTDMMAGFTAEDRAALAEETRWSAWAQRTRLYRTMVFLADEGQRLHHRPGTGCQRRTGFDARRIPRGRALFTPLILQRETFTTAISLTALSSTAHLKTASWTHSVLSECQFIRCTITGLKATMSRAKFTEFQNCTLNNIDWLSPGDGSFADPIEKLPRTAARNTTTSPRGPYKIQLCEGNEINARCLPSAISSKRGFLRKRTCWTSSFTSAIWKAKLSKKLADIKSTISSAASCRMQNLHCRRMSRRAEGVEDQIAVKIYRLKSCPCVYNSPPSIRTPMLPMLYAWMLRNDQYFRYCGGGTPRH